MYFAASCRAEYGVPSLKALYIEKIKRKVLKMKLAKKMLASVIALAVVAALALTAFAAAPVVSLTASKAVVGENVTITMSAKDMAGLESGGLEFTYDAEALEFVSIEKAAGASYDMGAGDKVEDMITWSFLFLESAKADSDIVTLTFKVLKAGDTDVAMRIDSWDGTEQPADVTVTVKAEEKVVPTQPTPTEPTPTEPTSKVEPSTNDKIPQTGEAGVAAIAGVMALAAVAFVATRKKDEE